jgi:hypothetical protein
VRDVEAELERPALRVEAGARRRRLYGTTEEEPSSVSATCSGVTCACPLPRARPSANLSTAAASPVSEWCTARITHTNTVR